ncbi:hypothetical protein Patl1_09584 [Pistacia atlantica]|uniref:Uncharacterized protein n=1 Tax=Pistacia atlantica TaxID=434234 RepID=A0ACC0ZZW6_9ROSI|nr:hypothetical protein Patl1_09584 [Pistacia atlantica]
MHEVIRGKAKYWGFSHFVNREHSNLSSKIRRISIQGSIDSVLESNKDSKIRSVSLFNVGKMPNCFVTTLIMDFKLIKVLDFEDSPIEYLPKEVGNLFHLHYLSVKNTRVNVLPRSIGKLLNLETLNLKRSLVSMLPAEIKNLKKLRYLVAYISVNFKELKELSKLRNLRKLGIRVTNGNEKDPYACIGNLEKLVCLSIQGTSREEILDIESMTSPPPGLERLHLKGNMKKLPDWILKLDHIERISLELSGLTDDPLRVLKDLPNLLDLMLWDTCHDERLHFKEGWFPKLKILELVDFKGVELMIIEKGAMPNLEDLRIGSCPRLKEIPIGIEHLRNLKILVFRLMLKEIYYMIKDEKWKEVTQHIPKISVTFIMKGKIYYHTTKYLSSVLPVDFEKYIKEVEQST